MKIWNRRDFLALSAAAGAASALPTNLLAANAKHEDFSFLFITDCHLQPELNAVGGCHQAFVKARAMKADFAIQGGDHVFDALGVPKERATSLMDLYTKTEQDLGLKVHHTIGNHDCFGIYEASDASPSDPLYGRNTLKIASASSTTPLTTKEFTSSCSIQSASQATAHMRAVSMQPNSPGLPQI